MDRKKVVIIGANGNIAHALITKLIKNFQVYSVTRSAPSFAINSIFLRFIQGDALSPDLWDQYLEGKDAVIGTFGVRNGEDEHRVLQFTKLIIQKMHQKGVKRFIGFYVHGALDQQGKPVYQQEDYANKQRAKYHSQAIAELQKSGLEWTAVYLWKFQEGKEEVAVRTEWSQTATDSDGLVNFVRKELQNAQWIGKAVFLSNKP